MFRSMMVLQQMIVPNETSISKDKHAAEYIPSTDNPVCGINGK